MKKLILTLTMFIVLAVFASAQNKLVTGVVLDDQGVPVIGASVLAKGTTTGTATDANGNFSISISPEIKMLVVSFIGMDSKEVLVKDQMTIRMNYTKLGLDEVVVTALGISKEKKALGYAATSVAGEDIAEAQVLNPMSAIQGRVAGVDITGAPGPGATQNVIIRGASSFGANQPLYVVDGVPIVNAQNRSGDNLNNQVDFGSGINALNPDDIEGVTILKGAAATALYGSRAANGVILITTKSGSDTNDKLKFNYDGNIGIQQIGRIPERQSMFGQGWSGIHNLDENGNWGPKYDGLDRVWGNVVDNSQLIKPYSFLPSRVRDFYDYGVTYKNSISASGGNDKTTYFLSASNSNVDGVLPGSVDTYDRTTISTRGSHKSGIFTVSSSINFSNEVNNVVPSGQGTSAFRSLWEIPEDISVVDMKDYNNKFYNLDNYFTLYGINPYFSLNENGASQEKNKFFGKAQIDADLLKNLKLTYRFGGDIENTTGESWESIIDFSEGSPNYGSSNANAGRYRIIKRTRYETNHDAFLNYNTKLAEDLNLNGLIGMNANEQGYDYTSGLVSALDVPGYYNLNNGLSDPVADKYSRIRRLIGVYANIDLDYKNYLYFTLTARNDWSSTLPIGNNSYFYPGITGSFLFNEFANQKDIDLGPISFGKIRLAYGFTGKDANPYVVYPTFEPGYSLNPGFPGLGDLSFPLDGVNSWMLSRGLGSPDLKPEITQEFEAGLEMNFFQNRLGFDFSYYNKLTVGLIQSLPMDPASGFISQVNNIGDVRNSGIEIMLNATPIKYKDFSWKLGLNYAMNDNKVEKLAGGAIHLGGYGSSDIIAIEGKELGIFRTAVPKTVDIDGKEYVVVDGSGMIQTAPDLEIIDKSINEKFRAGLSSTFIWKNISLGGTLDLRYGGYIYTYQKDYMQWTGSGIETTYNDRKPFIVPNSVIENADGSYSENTIPVASKDFHTFYTDGGFNKGSDFIIDKSYLKLRALTLGYIIPNSFSKKFRINSARISFVVDNILLWTPRENQYIDPETTTFGNDVEAKFGEYGAGPTNQTYTMSLSLSF